MKKKSVFCILLAVLAVCLALAGACTPKPQDSANADTAMESLSEDPDAAHVLDILAALPDDAQELAEKGCFVMTNDGKCYGTDVLNSFLTQYGEKESVALIIGQYTIEGDLILSHISYDGEKITLTKDARRDKFAGELTSEETYQYFSLLEYTGEDGTMYENIVVHDDPELTNDKMVQILASSQFEEGQKKQFDWIGTFAADAAGVSLGDTAGVSSGDTSGESSADAAQDLDEGTVPEQKGKGLPKYEYSGDDPIEEVITEYFLEEYGEEERDAVTIPAFCIFLSEVDANDPDTVNVYGNFWSFTYQKNGSVLECISGGENPGVMHVTKSGEGYSVRFDHARDGDYYAEDISSFCNGNRSLEEQYFAATDAAKDPLFKKRAWYVQQYVAATGLDVDSYQDYGWEPVYLSDVVFDGVEE